MQIQKTPKCDKCGKRKKIVPGALPAMVGFQLEDGTVISLCKDCLIKLGSMKKEGREEFFKDILKGEENGDV